MKLSIIIPMYNEASTIAAVLEKVSAVDLPGIEKEIVVSDDGSTDDSLDCVGKYVARSGCHISLITSSGNRGKGAAIRGGMRRATGDIVMIQDADLELNPDEYKYLLAPMLAGKADVVYGSRFRKRNNGIPLRTIFANKLLTALTNLLYQAHLTDMETAYKVMRSRVVRGIKLRCNRFNIEPEITAELLKRGNVIHEIPISYNPRTGAEGKKIGWRDGISAVITLLSRRFFS